MPPSCSSRNSPPSCSQSAYTTFNPRDSDDSLAVSIQNWGAVPEEMKPVFFEKYATAGKTKGLGLGTYMGKLVATAHGGDITCTSPQEELTEILMTLPLPKHH